MRAVSVATAGRRASPGTSASSSSSNRSASHRRHSLRRLLARKACTHQRQSRARRRLAFSSSPRSAEQEATSACAVLFAAASGREALLASAKAFSLPQGAEWPVPDSSERHSFSRCCPPSLSLVSSSSSSSRPPPSLPSSPSSSFSAFPAVTGRLLARAAPFAFLLRRNRSLSRRPSSMPSLLLLSCIFSVFLSPGSSLPLHSASSSFLSHAAGGLSSSPSLSARSCPSAPSTVASQRCPMSASKPSVGGHRDACDGSESKMQFSCVSRCAFPSPIRRPFSSSSSSPLGSSPLPSALTFAFPSSLSVVSSPSAQGPRHFRSASVSHRASCGQSRMWTRPSGSFASARPAASSLKSLPFSSLLLTREFLFSPSLCQPPSLAHALHRRAQLLLYLRDQGSILGLRGSNAFAAASTLLGASLGALLIWRALHALSAFFAKQQKRQQMEEVSLCGHYEDPTLASEAADAVRRAREAPLKNRCTDTSAVFNRLQELAEESDEKLAALHRERDTGERDRRRLGDVRKVKQKDDRRDTEKSQQRETTKERLADSSTETTKAAKIEKKKNGETRSTVSPVAQKKEEKRRVHAGKAPETRRSGATKTSVTTLTKVKK
ncbi:hypothetical protein TGPRC2_228270 [Toxoplasma gondii TgCatPRC2]|uniref:Uncharacterized protein n=1 Tax=Toxoplasma gondii TgCatPRC2 TaxID=1130821 RepID=A0A151H714_TOXGO|nr:hypothetical protein TGPRC2_228270 [Toxoplasma gondii TgCatPRC2]